MDPKQFSASQYAIWKQFGEAVSDCKLRTSDPTYLLYWLLVCDFNLDKAEKMLRKSLEWRRQFRIEANFKPAEVLIKYGAIGCIGQDKLLGPLWIHRFGRTDLEGILHSVKTKDYLRNTIQMTERVISQIFANPEKYRRSADVLVQSTIIFDMEGFSMNQIASKRVGDMVIQLVSIMESNYPEFYRRIIIINAPKIFSIAYATIKPLLNQRTKMKISVFNQDEEQWKPAILAEVDPDKLPASYGGTLTDPDGNGNCISMVGMGGTVPKSYYFNGKPDITDKKLLIVPNGSKKHLDFQIDKVGTYIKWNFHSEDNDIGFAVYQKLGSEFLPIVAHERIDCHWLAEEGEIRCDETGGYVIEFDNSFSFFKSKSIWYSITIEHQNRNREHDASAG